MVDRDVLVVLFISILARRLLTTISTVLGHFVLQSGMSSHFMLQFATLYACYKAASSLSHWPCYACERSHFLGKITHCIL